jgi:ankyrin repeat protein
MKKLSDCEVLKFRIASHKDINEAEPGTRRTMLHLACSTASCKCCRQGATVQSLVADGANVNAADLDGTTPLMVRLRIH